MKKREGSGREHSASVLLAVIYAQTTAKREEESHFFPSLGGGLAARLTSDSTYGLPSRGQQRPRSVIGEIHTAL